MGKLGIVWDQKMFPHPILCALVRRDDSSSLPSNCSEVANMRRRLLAAALLGVPVAVMPRPAGLLQHDAPGVVRAARVRAGQANAGRFEPAPYPNVDPSGSSDSAPGLRAAQLRVQNAGAGLMILPSGNYRLGADVSSLPGMTWKLEGVDLHGGILTGCTDASVIAGHTGMAWCRVAAGPGSRPRSTQVHLFKGRRIRLAPRRPPSMRG
jgi:hypothetical protein